PETVASRLVWAVGYYTNEDYFLPVLRVRNVPRLQRGQNLVSPDGSIKNLRLKRYLKGEKKIALWRWHRNPFVGTRELNGLRVMMALINNWTLKTTTTLLTKSKPGRAPAVQNFATWSATLAQASAPQVGAGPRPAREAI